MKVKICGLSRPEDIACVNRLRPDFIGFVFAPSKRQVSIAQAAALKKTLRPEIPAVGVFVNAEAAQITLLAQAGIIDYIQLHGDEDAAFCQYIKQATGLPVIRAVRVRDAASLQGLNNYPCDYFLFDTFVSGSYGGSGLTFDTALLAGGAIARPYFIAGGLTAENVGEGTRLPPLGVDGAGGVATTPG